MIEVARHVYPDRETLMRDLAELVADQLRAAHAGKGHATLAVPGGTTPGFPRPPGTAWSRRRSLAKALRARLSLSPRPP